MRIIICILFTVVLFVSSCKKQNEIKRYPSDHLFAQRAFPYNKIDHQAFQNALKSRNSFLQNRNINYELSWENLGPYNLDGRVTDIEIHPENDALIYAGSASGGVFKSEDSGDNWRPLFDENDNLSIGDIAIYKSNPDILYVGTGESNAGGGSLAYDGIGVFKSTDAGESWQAKGPSNIGSIGKVVIDPSDPEIIFIAAMGSLFANNPDRGVYKSSNGGNTWDQILTVSDSTGAIDLAMHPSNGNIIYAAMWERRRRPHDRNYGGPTSGIYKSIDGGSTWSELLNGLPQDNNKGRIGLAISESTPNIIYAYYLFANGQIRAIYKSEDNGENWIEKSKEGVRSTGYNWWFGKIFVNPKDPDHIILTSLEMHQSKDGGDTWETIFVNAHVDQHAVAFSYQDDEKIYIGNDGGVYEGNSVNNSFANYKTGLGNYQFYTCEIDNNNPNRIYGGAQDNGTLRTEGDSENWESLFGGDGFRVLVDPNNSNNIYLEYQYGNINKSTNGGVSFRAATNGLTGDYNWNTPIEMDPSETSTLYTGAQQLFRSVDGANTWEAISPSLVNSDNPTGVLTYGSLTTINVSPLNSDIIYIGTDDGNVWVSRDRGETYNSINSGLPRRWMTSIVADPFNESGVYITVSGFRFNESSSQVFYSSDFGNDWTDIGSNLPDTPLNDIVVDPDEKGFLYVASDVGVFYSTDNGLEWQLLGIDMPIVPILDLDYESKSRQLVAASFGRGMFKYNLPQISNTEQLVNVKLNVYPNPTSNLLNIDSDCLINNVKIYNANAQLVLKTTGIKDLSIDFFESGIYYLHINCANGNILKKIIKQ